MILTWVFNQICEGNKMHLHIKKKKKVQESQEIIPREPLSKPSPPRLHALLMIFSLATLFPSTCMPCNNCHFFFCTEQSKWYKISLQTLWPTGKISKWTMPLTSRNVINMTCYLRLQVSQDLSTFIYLLDIIVHVDSTL